MEGDLDTEIYTVKTSSFEGPFALLLSLVEERKLFINDVSLADVTEDYINYVNRLSQSDPAQMSNFIVVAATLILIKSKSLLPNLDLTNEEESDVRILEERLRLYNLYSEFSLNVKNIFGKKIIFPLLERKNKILIFLPDTQITKDKMMTYARDVLGNVPKKVFLNEIEVKKVISIEEMIDRLTDRIQNSLQMNFKDFSGFSQGVGNSNISRQERVVIIVSFLAMLELTRQGIINVTQNDNFEDIQMEKITIEEDILEI